MPGLEALYAVLPVWSQNLAVSVYGAWWHWLRFGPGYQHALQGYLEREWFSSRQWQDWQRQNALDLLRETVEHVPYYQETWSVAEQKAARVGRWLELPLLDKEPLRRDPDQFLLKTKRRVYPLAFHTSGSTGTPVKSLWTTAELRNSMALREARSARWAGVSFNLPRATFSGRLVVPETHKSGPIYRYNRVEKQVYLSAFHLKPESAGDYVQALRKHKIQWLTGYAVSYALLAKTILEQGIAVPQIKAIITTSEKLTNEMRQTIAAAFRCSVFEEYSTVENAVFVSECEYGRLHTSPDAAILEILRPDGAPCDPGETGEVVGTCLFRKRQPLIRYRLGDLASWDPEPCPCRRKMPVIKEIAGRLEDVIRGPDRRELVRFHGLFVDQPHIREGQVIQESLTRLRIKIVTVAGFSQVDSDNLIARVHQRLGNQMEVRVETVDSIPRTPAGKFKAVVNLMDKYPP